MGAKAASLACLSVLFGGSHRSAGAAEQIKSWTQVWGIRAAAFKPLVKHLVEDDRRARPTEPSPASLRVEKQMTRYVFDPVFLIDVVNQYPACYTSLPCKASLKYHYSVHSTRTSHVVSGCGVGATTVAPGFCWDAFLLLFLVEQCKGWFAKVSWMTERMRCSSLYQLSRVLFGGTVLFLFGVWRTSSPSVDWGVARRVHSRDSFFVAFIFLTIE